MANPVDVFPPQGIEENTESELDGINPEDLKWEDDSPTRFNLSFAGCGFLGIYHLGVAQTLVRHGGTFLSQVDCFTGASAGALVAGVLAVKGRDQAVVEAGIKFCYDSAMMVEKKTLGLLTPKFSMLDPLEAFLIEQLPPDAHQIATDRLYVSMTSLENRRNVIISQFDTKQDLITCLLASSYVPFVTGSKEVEWNGKKYIDGGMTNNLPTISGGRMVYVSPFSGKQDICPRDKEGRKWYCRINQQDFQVNLNNIIRGLHAFFPPKLKDLETYFDKGIRDATLFLKKENLYEPIRKPPSSPKVKVKPEVQYESNF